MDIDLDDEIGKFLTQLDLEKNSGKNVLFVQGEYYLADASTFYQYILHKKKLVTLIGEFHNMSFGCEKQPISIATYCLDRVQRNPKCLVLLEFNKTADMRYIYSHVIQEIYGTLVSGGKESQIFPYDFRPWFLSVRLQGELYNNNYVIKNYADYIDPYYTTKLNGGVSPFQLDEAKYSIFTLSFMQHYFSKINEEFHHIGGLFTKNKQHRDLRRLLQHAWALVCDYFIFREILQENSPFNDFVIISGEFHRRNLSHQLTENNAVFLGEQHGEQGKCINLFQTYYL